MRLFIGIELPNHIKIALSDFHGELKNLGAKGKWKHVENIHLTIEFLGEVAPEDVNLIKEALISGAEGKKAFQLRVGGVGVFPSLRRPHTLWTDLSGDIKELELLYDDIHKELISKTVRVEERPYRPHITLLSRALIKGIELSALSKKEIGEFQVKEIILFESTVEQGKRVYKHLHIARLEN